MARKWLHRYPDITEGDLRKMRGLVRKLASTANWNEFGHEVVWGCNGVIENESPCWNVFKPDMESLIAFDSFPCFGKRFHGLLEQFQNTLNHHPVLKPKGWDTMREGPSRLTDFEPSSTFRHNPLYREVYRHLNSDYQIGLTLVELSDRTLVLTMNRASIDYTDHEFQKAHVLGDMINHVAQQMDRRLQAELSLAELADIIGSHACLEGTERLTRRELHVLTGLREENKLAGVSRKLGVSLKTVDESLGVIREKLGLDSTHQLRAALRCLDLE